MRPSGAADDAAYFVVNPGAGSPFLFVGDHSGREIPPELRQLGLAPAELERHIAWDIGVTFLGEALAARLDAPFIRQRWSRLVIDCNRDPARDDSIVEVSDGAPIPGNRDLSEDERRWRRETAFEPYHARIAAEIGARAQRGLATTLVALHSFTPQLAGQPQRPWRFGVLHLHNSPYSRRVLRRLCDEEGADFVGDNEPYSMDNVDFTVPHHCRAHGLDYLELETRQDLIADRAHADIIAERLAVVLTESL